MQHPLAAIGQARQQSTHSMDTQDAFQFVCVNCGAIVRSTRHVDDCPRCGAIGRRNVLEILGKESSCSFISIVQRLSNIGIAGLDRCRQSDCGLMHILELDGPMGCVGMGGKKCGWIDLWAKRLNRKMEFATGGYECPHWKSIEPSIDS